MTTETPAAAAAAAAAAVWYYRSCAICDTENTTLTTILDCRFCLQNDKTTTFFTCNMSSSKGIGQFCTLFLICIPNNNPCAWMRMSLFQEI